MSPSSGNLLGFEPEELEGKDPYDLIHDDDQEHIRETHRFLKHGKESEQQLYRKSRELEKINAELEHFTYILSHDLRSPVANLQSLTALLDNDSLTEENKAMVHKMDFEKNPVVCFSKSKLKSILLNLLTNAIKYRSPDRDLLIRIRSGITRNYDYIEVEDSGRGIDLGKYGDSLFKAYDRLHEDDQDRIKGSGLGLYVVKSQLQSLGGKIEVESEVDIGTTFRIYLEHAET